MSDKLKVNIIITTYDNGNGARFNLLYQTVQALVDNLIYPNLGFILTDDGSPNHYEMVKKVSEIIPSDDIIFFDTGRRGVGFAKNNALKEAFKTSPITLLLEDDWLLRQPLNLLPYVQLMLDYPKTGMIRFGFLGGQMEATYGDYGFFQTFWKLKPNSGLYVYSGQVSLRSQYFYSQFGWHDETLAPGEEELNACWRYNELTDPPDILWDASFSSKLNGGPFINIGLSPDVSVNSIKPGS